ncbi:hypothetical protein J1N35_035111 [Gossypium stocksii]|uniref:Uncharacterized protein n=1 Tax=Gossypium stocksii TaxID=47602 RepID=A0A9D3UTA9_9ROSI|nr:hypothetical protein J1N35_035111 [Gossypium stocksii]
MPKRNPILWSKTMDNEANLDQNAQIEMVFKSLSKDFASFRATYNLGNNNLTLTQLIKELQSYEFMLNGGQQIQKLEENLMVAKRNNGQSSGPQKWKGRELISLKTYPSLNVSFANKKGHFKANYKEWNGLLLLVAAISIYFSQDLNCKDIFGNTKMVSPIDAPDID